MVASRLRRFKHAPLVVVGLVGAVSFLLADVGSTGYAPSWLLGFYSPVTRAWEFAGGALLALVAARLTLESRSLALGLGLLGAGMLAGSLWLISGSTPFPGSWTLLPVVGALLLLLAGTNSSNIVTRTLATRPLTAIGDRSYSIYLWHWPFIAFAAVLWPETSYAPLVAAVLSLAPALASYRWVEQPVRSFQGFTTPRLVTLVAAVVLSPLLVAVAVGSAATHFWTPRYESGEVAIANDGDIGQDEYLSQLRDSFYPCTRRTFEQEL